MYQMKPVFRVPPEIPNTCPMYKLKSLHDKVVGAFVSSKQDMMEEILLSNKELDELLSKQKEVLHTLEQLELRLSKLDIQSSDAKDNLLVTEKLSAKPTINQVTSKIYEKKLENEIIDNIVNLIKTDTVIFADPENPPYSLLALPILWPTVSWDISYHIHSSVPKDLKGLETIKAFKNVSCKHKKNIIKIFVIWQNTKPGPKIVRSPLETLIGEVPFLKLFDQYLATEKLTNLDQENFNKDLDLVHEISCSMNDRTSELNNLVNVSDLQLDIKNVAIWSLLYKKNNKLPKLEKWFQCITKIIISQI